MTSFPANPLEFLVALFVGEIGCIGLGAAIAIRTKKRKNMEDNHAASKAVPSYSEQSTLNSPK